MELKVKRVSPDAILPSYQTAGSVGLDLHACIPENTDHNPLPSRKTLIGAGKRRLIKTGIAIELPFGCEGQIRPRSGIALKRGLTVLNAPGTIDTDYRGEVGVILINVSDHPQWVEHGERIAQLIVAPVTIVTTTLVEQLVCTKRGENGFGSTGEK